jgi:hypothetical protein
VGRVVITHEALRGLATAEARRLVISVHARTDPRDPANIGTSPGWLIALRNGLSAAGKRLEAGDDREARLAFRTLRRRIEQGFTDLSPIGRARSVTWILDPDGDSQRYSLQLPLRGDKVVADTKPYISPLVDVADRGARTGVILVSGELVRLVQIEQAEASEPPDSTYELSLGDWRPFGGSAGGSPARGLQSTAHEERYRARVEAQRDQLFETAARQTGKRLEALGWERIVLVSETQVVSRFREGLPPEVAERVIAESDSNLAGEEPAAIADAIEPLIEEAWQTRSNALVELARDRARAGGPATIGAQETFGALTEGRVEHLILDPDRDLSTTGSIVPPLIEGRSELLGERAVEAAIATSAQVTAVSAVTSPVLAELGGIAALLRY